MKRIIASVMVLAMALALVSSLALSASASTDYSVEFNFLETSTYESSVVYNSGMKPAGDSRSYGYKGWLGSKNATGANSVHSLFDTVAKVDDLGILTAKLDCNVGLRSNLLKSRCHSHDLLDKLYIQSLAEIDRARTRYLHLQATLAELFLGLKQKLCQRFLRMSTMTAVLAVYYVVLSVHDDELYCRGVDVYSCTIFLQLGNLLCDALEVTV